MRCLVWLGRFKCIATGLDASLSSFSTSRRFSRNRLPSRLPVSLRSRRYFLSVTNERTNFVSCARAFDSSRLNVSEKCPTDKKVAHVFVAFE